MPLRTRERRHTKKQRGKKYISLKDVSAPIAVAIVPVSPKL